MNKETRHGVAALLTGAGLFGVGAATSTVVETFGSYLWAAGLCLALVGLSVIVMELLDLN